MSRMFLLGILLAVLIAAALRLPQLDARPMHNDEGLNAEILKTLWNKGVYQYDPNEFHGPTLPYFTCAWMKLVGPEKFVDFTETQLRMVTVLLGLGLVLLLPLVADGLGKRATVCAAVLTAISPAMVFYSRYYIHEMLLVFFTLMALAAGWRWFRSGKLGWAILCGAAVGLMQTTKETFVLALGAAIGAVVLNRIFRPTRNALTENPSPEPASAGARAVPACSGQDDERAPEKVATSADIQTAASRDGSRSARTPLKHGLEHLAIALGIWLVVVIVLFSSFFTNASGPLDAVRTYLPWLHRVAGASPHIHPWYFYLERLAWFHTGKGPVWSEGLILGLAVLGLAATFVRNGLVEGDVRFIRFLAFYTVILTSVYCAIGYKTPWCLLSFWNGMILLAGVGTVALLHWLGSRPLQIAAGLLLLAGCTQLTRQAWRAGGAYAADPRNPYVYAQTVPNVIDLIEKVNAITAASPQKNHTMIKVMAPENDYGPLPWYLRRFDESGWYPAVPADPYAPVMIVSTKFNAALDEKKTHLMIGLYELRPQNWFEVYVGTSLWDSYLKARQSASQPKAGSESAAK